MKTFSILSLGLAFTFSTRAALVTFQLSPPGSDQAAGLSPSNQVPPAVGSSGSGGDISGGIVYDPSNSVLEVAVGYGSSAGFSNLTGPVIAIDIHGPAGPGTNTNILVNLLPYNFTAANLTNGGVIFGDLLWPTNDTAALLAGLTYLEIHTAQFTNGELRAQLIPVIETNAPPTNGAPTVLCPPSGTIECGSSTTLVATVSDPEGDPLAVLWVINGKRVETNQLPAGQPGAAVTVPLTQTLPLGTNQIQVFVTDIATNVASCSNTIVVVDTKPPVITSASASPASLWPPNHKLVDVSVSACVVDTCSATTWKIIKVTSNEPVKGHGSGNTSPDWVITGDHTVKLRAERSGNGNGRVYTITLQATDAAGNVSATQTVTVAVAKSHGHGADQEYRFGL